MDDRLSIPPVRVPAVLPHPDDLFVTLVKDEHSSSINITSPLTAETVPNNEDARAAIHAIRRLRQVLTSPYNTPDAILDRPTWLRVIMETLASIHEGFHTAQLASPDEDLPDSFRNLSPEELNTVGHIFDITGSIHDFCEPVDENPDETFRALCVRCVQAIDLPPPPAHITNIMLSNALEARAIRETLRNEAIRKAVHDIDLWRETQQTALVDSLVSDIVNPETDLEAVARSLGKLDPWIEAWVNTIRPHLKDTILKMVAQEPIEDFVSPQVEEILHNAWTKKQAELNAKLEAKTTEYLTQLHTESEEFLAAKKQTLIDEAETSLQKFELELKAKTEDEIQRLKSKYKTTMQTAKDDNEARSLSLAIRTPKATKPSPLNITKPKKKKKKVTVLDLTTPSPGPEGQEIGNEISDSHTDMETEADSTPTTPICRSSAPSPTPHPQVAPETVTTAIANPADIPRWAQTPSPDDKTPHAPHFPAPPPSTDLAQIMAAISGIKSELLSRIEQVNARIDQTSGPTDIPSYMAWEHDNLAAYEHPAYVDPAQDATMEALEEANTAREVERLEQERVYHSLMHRYVGDGRLHTITDDAYLDKWNDTCRGIFTSLSWPHSTPLTDTQDQTILNAWRRAEVVLDDYGLELSTTTIFERLTGTKPNLSTTDGRKAFNNFTTCYNRFCAENDFNPTDGFEETHDRFFRLFSKSLQTSSPVPAPTAAPKSVRFTSVPPIATLPNAPSSSPDDDFPALHAPSSTPISYASATAAFTPVTRRRRNKSDTTKTTTPTTAQQAKPTAPPAKPGSKSTRPEKPPLPDALKTTKHTIILDHSNPETRSKYSLDAGELTHGLQKHLEAVKAPLVLLAGAWSTAPFYKNFILTFSGIVSYTDITKFNSVLFGPFGDNCRAAPTAGYQSILISGVRL